MRRKKQTAAPQAERSFELEDDFDLAALGFDLGGVPVEGTTLSKLTELEGVSGHMVPGDGRRRDQDATELDKATTSVGEGAVKEKDFVHMELDGDDTEATMVAEEVPNDKTSNLGKEEAELEIPVAVEVTVDPTPSLGQEVAPGMSRSASAISGIMTGTETVSTVSSAKPGGIPSPPIKREYKARLVLDRRPGRKVLRLAIKVTRRRVRARPNSPSISSRPPSRCKTPPPPPPSELTKDFAAAFSHSTLDQLNTYAKAYNTNGHLLPLSLRDFLPSIVDRQNAVQIANEVRQHLHLPLLSTRTDRVALQKALARMRERLYVELYAGLCLPLAPRPIQLEAKGEEGEGDEVERPSLSLTPSSLHHLSIHLPQVYPHDRAGIRAVFQTGSEYGEQGDVVWQAGVGHMARNKQGGGLGYRGELAEGAGGVHVFVDYSNILHGLLHSLYSDPRPLPPRHARILSLPCLSLLLTRGRHHSPGALHLVASSPLHQNMDTLVRLGWEVSIMKRVEIYEAEVVDYGAGKLVPRATKGVVEGPGRRHEGGTGTEGGDKEKAGRDQAGKGAKHGSGVNGVGGSGVMMTEETKKEGEAVQTGKGQSVIGDVEDTDVNGDAARRNNDDKIADVPRPSNAIDASAARTSRPHAADRDIGKSSAIGPSDVPLAPAPPPPPPPPGPAPGLRRYKEQGVDEILTLKLLQTIYAHDIAPSSSVPASHIPTNGVPSTSTPNGHDTHHPALPSTSTPVKRSKPIGTIVLATGDARGGQFNAGGFLGAVRHAIKRGWAVELWSFASGLSRAWRETAKREGWDGRFRVHVMDEWKEWLVDVNEELVE